jgi:hypothetical protein
MSAQEIQQKELRRKEQTGDTLYQTSFLLLATDRRLKECVEDGMHAVRIAWGTGWACMGKGACDERDATVKRCCFL